MKTSIRLAVVVALAGSFMAGRASSRQEAGDPASSSCPAAVASSASAEASPAPPPWAVQGFRGAECQILGDIPECD